MASAKLAYMPQESNMMPQYLQEQNLRSSMGSKSGLWSSAPPATPQTSNASMSSVWGSPLSILPSTASSGSASVAPAMRSHSQATVQSPDFAPQSLAALAADSEPVMSTDASVSAGFPPSMNSTSSQLSSRHNSQTEIASPLIQGGATGPTVPANGSSPAAASPSACSTLTSSPSVTSLKNAGNSISNDEIINTAIVVKNIPFAIKKEQLIEFMSQLGLPLPYAFNYHFDNGVFRGLAFANFTTAEETAAVISSLNGSELGGRKLRVEYKKMLPFQERERIEREKRERRGQLEEQHQQTQQGKAQNGPGSSSAQQQGNAAGVGAGSSNSSSGSAATNAANANAGSGVGVAVGNGAEVLGGAPAASPMTSMTSVSALAQQAPQPTALKALSRPSSVSGSPRALNQPLMIDMNDPETLQTYTSLVLFKRDLTASELCVPSTYAVLMSRSRINIVRTLAQRLDLSCQLFEDQTLVVAKKMESNGLFKTEPDTDADVYRSGVFKDAIVTPSTNYALSRMNAPTLAPVTSKLNAMNAVNRWNSVSNLASLGGANLGTGGSILTHKSTKN